MLETLPLANITSFLGIVLIVVFFVTSSDSGSLVIDTITAGGKLDAPVAQRVFWCVLEGIVAIALLLGGGLVAAQAATLATGLPFARRCCTARSKSLTSLCRLQSHPAQYVSGIPSAAILLSISHPIRCSTRCLANVRARISGPMIAL